MCSSRALYLFNIDEFSILPWFSLHLSAPERLTVSMLSEQMTMDRLPSSQTASCFGIVLSATYLFKILQTIFAVSSVSPVKVCVLLQ